MVEKTSLTAVRRSTSKGSIIGGEYRQLARGL